MWHVEVGRIGREVFQRTGLAVVERACVEQTDAERLLAQLAGFFGRGYYYGLFDVKMLGSVGTNGCCR